MRQLIGCFHEYHYENYVGKYDFFDFPNQFNKDVKITPVIDFRKVRYLLVIQRLVIGVNTPMIVILINQIYLLKRIYVFNPMIQNLKTYIKMTITKSKFNYRYFTTAFISQMYRD